MKSVIILSGGMDSVSLLYKLVAENKEVSAISFYYGQKHSRELEMAKLNCQKLNIHHEIVDISNITKLISNSALTGDIEVPKGHYEDENMKKTVVPNRNMIMASIAISYTVNIDADEIALGVHAGDHAIYPDCREIFIDALRAIAKVANYKEIGVYTPYLKIDKGDIVADGLKNGVDYSLTWTCYEGKEKPCKECGSCSERIEAFEKNNMIDPLL